MSTTPAETASSAATVPTTPLGERGARQKERQSQNMQIAHIAVLLAHSIPRATARYQPQVPSPQPRVEALQRLPPSGTL
jgi:hypothetical protein